jgi:hypothetical protein
MIETKRLKSELTQTTIDVETGELITTTQSKTFSVKINQDEFFMTYFEQLAGFFELTSAKEILLMVKLCGIAEFNTGRVFLTAERRKELMEQLSMSKNYISVCLKSLADKKLIKGTRNDYVINPIVFWKGNNKTRNEMIKAKGKLQINIEFTPND